MRVKRAHTFSRSAPAEDLFPCLKPTAETDTAASIRACLPLPVRSATGVVGHGQRVTPEDAAPSLSSAH